MPEPIPSRPIAPEGYGIPADGSGADVLPWPQVEEWLTRARNYWVSSASPDGRPHAIPVWGVWLDGAVMFATSRASRKALNLSENPRAVIHLESGDEVVILHGAVEEVADVTLLNRFADAYEAKYDIRPDPESPGDVVYMLRPASALTWLERDFPNTATRWRCR